MLALKKLKTAIKNPVAVKEYIINKKYSWPKSKSANKINTRQYKIYSEYTKHQKLKLNTLKNSWLPKYDIDYRKALRERLSKHTFVKSGATALCLAARIGTEVKSFLDLGAFATGIDLNPGKENKYVLYGDFHNIQFSDSSVDIVFSNSLDHALDIPKLASEIKRVVKPTGKVILEINFGEKEGFKPGYYEVATWEKIEDVLTIFQKQGFKIVFKSAFEYPWPGEHVVMTLQA